MKTIRFSFRNLFEMEYETSHQHGYF